jgi:hypothetical protein
MVKTMQQIGWLLLSLVLSSCALLEDDPAFVDIGPCAGLTIEDSPACFASAAVFVAPGGSGEGGPDAPMGSVPEAILAAKTRGAQVVFIAGDHTLTQPIELVEGVSLLGGRQARTWAPSGAPSTLTMQLDGAVSIGLSAADIKTLTRVHHLTLIIPDAPAGRQAQIGAQLLRSPGVLLDAVTIRVGRGADGQPGADGVDGAAGEDGGDADGRTGGASGAAQCTGAAGSRGGNGGVRSGANNTAPTSGETTARGIVGGGPSAAGGAGMPGARGADGAAGAASEVDAQGWRLGAAASKGEDGEDGQGGAGGGGGEVREMDGEGGGGGGGGGGGCGGMGGRPGTAGTDIVGVVLVGPSATLKGVSVEVGAGGASGAGGLGGRGGAGGRGGSFALGRGGGSAGGAGGDGAAGGDGGNGGAGRAGVSLGIACQATMRVIGDRIRVTHQEGGKIGKSDRRALSGASSGCQLP